MKKLNFLFGLLAILTILTGCADVSHVQECLPVTEHTYGFWGGVWHGMITWFSFIGSLFSDDIAVYAVNNNGAWYDFGFVGGLGFMLRMIGYVIQGILAAK
jgi:hypothetical protein